MFVRTSTSDTWEEIDAGVNTVSGSTYTHTFTNSGTELYYHILGTTGTVLTRVVMDNYA